MVDLAGFNYSKFNAKAKTKSIALIYLGCIAIISNQMRNVHSWFQVCNQWLIYASFPHHQSTINEMHVGVLQMKIERDKFGITCLQNASIGVWVLF